MIVYDGSSHIFKVLSLVKKNTRESSLLNEGLGIYFSSDRNIASSYGRYLYSLNVSDKLVWDFRGKRHCNALVNNFGTTFSKRWGIHLWRFVDPVSLVEYLHEGNIAIVGLAEEVRQLLLSSEQFCMMYQGKIESISTWLGHWTGYPSAYFFPYSIKDCGVIKDVSPDVVKIIGKEKLI